VQNCSPDADAQTLRKFPVHLRVWLKETDSAKPVTGTALNLDSELAEGGNRFGHQSFAAGLVNRRLGTVGDDDGHSALPCGDRSRKTGGTAPNHKNIHFCFAGDHS
jgi:hypothetical protein